MNDLAEKFYELVNAEYLSAARHHKPLNSLHEAYAVILEEVDELWDHVRQKASMRDRAAVLNELVQIAAMCQRTATDLAFISDE